MTDQFRGDCLGAEGHPAVRTPNLEKDPGEEHNLASEPGQAATLRLWRVRMIRSMEGRGAPFVVNGDLALRPEGTLYSPNYPKRQDKG